MASFLFNDVLTYWERKQPTFLSDLRLVDQKALGLRSEVSTARFEVYINLKDEEEDAGTLHIEYLFKLSSFLTF